MDTTDLPWQCNALLEATSIRNILPSVESTWQLNNYHCFLMGRHSNSVLKDQKIVIPIRIHAQHETNESAFYVELLLPHIHVCLWVKSLANLKARILNLEDKISFLRSTYVWCPINREFYRLSAIWSKCIFPKRNENILCQLFKRTPSKKKRKLENTVS
jgi:hypothetical protein